MNLELKHRLTKVLIKLLVKNIKIKLSQSIQLNMRSNTLSSIKLEEIVNFIELKFSQIKYVS